MTERNRHNPNYNTPGPSRENRLVLRGERVLHEFSDTHQRITPRAFSSEALRELVSP
jgi:hypothetical protein